MLDFSHNFTPISDSICIGVMLLSVAFFTVWSAASLPEMPMDNGIQQKIFGKNFKGLEIMPDFLYYNVIIEKVLNCLKCRE